MTGQVTTISLYVAGLLGLIAVEVTARRTGSVATLAETLDRLMRHRPTQVCVLLVWWWLGWHFLAD
jgi:ABC-type arginine transport system permease subunit